MRSPSALGAFNCIPSHTKDFRSVSPGHGRLTPCELVAETNWCSLRWDNLCILKCLTARCGAWRGARRPCGSVQRARCCCVVVFGTYFLLAADASRGGAVRGAESPPRRGQRRLFMFTACTRSYTYTRTHRVCTPDLENTRDTTCLPCEALW